MDRQFRRNNAQLGSLLFLALWAFLFSQNANAEQSRFALVIGNADYAEGKLLNPVNDAILMSNTLRSKGFDVTTRKNATWRQMKEAIRDFTFKLDEKSVGLFYFAGHGIEFEGNNYIIPIDADIVREEDIEYESVNAGRVLSGFKQTKNELNLVILDACRNNPYSRGFRSKTRGLNRMQPATGSLILYATEPGNVASDGVGDNGVFTEHLVKAINTQGLSIENVFKTTAINVSQATGKKQIPYIEGVILGEFYFDGSDKFDSPPAETASTNIDLTAIEKEFWGEVKADPSKKMYEAYLKVYPGGFYAEIAKVKIANLSNTSSTAEKRNTPVEPKYDIPSLSANIRQFKLFDIRKSDVKDFKTKFTSFGTDYVYWYLDIKFPLTKRDVKFKVDAVWRKSSGGLVGKDSYDLHIPQGRTVRTYWGGWGRRAGGWWKVGSYVVELSVNGEKIGERPFKVVY